MLKLSRKMDLELKLPFGSSFTKELFFLELILNQAR
jgi:hypothetical protein